MDKPRYVEIYDNTIDHLLIYTYKYIHIQTDSIRMKLISNTFNLYSKYV